MKRVLVFCLTFHPHVGGAEVALREITDRIPDVEFHLITARLRSASLPHERIGRIEVHRVGFGSRYLSKILFIPRATVAAWRLLRSRHFDGMWAMMSYMLFPIVLLRLSGVRLPYLLTLQEGDSFERVYERWFIRPLRPLLSYGFRHAAVVQVISTFLGGWARRMGYPGPLEVIPNGVSFEAFSKEPMPQEKLALLQKLGKEEGEVRLVTVSRLVAKNAVDDIIRALSRLPRNVKLLILGSGSARSALERLARELDVSERVTFLGDVPYERVPLYLHVSDIFVRPSRTEGMGNVFVEAMAAGLPVIATQEGGIAEFLFDRKKNPGRPATGWAVEKDSPEQIANTVMEILKGPEEAKRVVAQARALVQEKYEWDDIARKMRERAIARISR
jgi:glycosyltransferase involved in cell wall biosynthesis